MDAHSPDRRRPHHFARERYEVERQPVWFTSCTHDRRPSLVTGAAPAILAQVLTDRALTCGCALTAWCIMPDHLHLLGYVHAPGGSTWRMMESIRRLSARLLARLGLPTPIWQRDFWDRHVRDHENLVEVIDYILDNPIRVGLCARREDWPHWAFFGNANPYVGHGDGGGL